MRLALFCLIVAGAVSSYAAGVVGKTVEYSSGSVTMKGYLVYSDKIQGKRPGILVVHEWWGLNDYSRKRADMLAELGYVAFAVDMYGDGKNVDNPSDAGKLAGEVMQNTSAMRTRFLAAMDFLKKDARVDSTDIAAIGYCFGGGVVLAMARNGADLKGVASFHGTLATQTPAKPGEIKGKVLVLTGTADKFVPPKDVQNFKSEMEAAKVDYKVVGYPGAMHAFTNPAATELGKKFNLPLAYNENADKKSWTEMKKFFRSIFKK